jgi:hypothetical protein
MYLFCPWCRSTFGLAAPYDDHHRVSAICVACCKRIATGELKLEPFDAPPDDERLEAHHVLDALKASHKAQELRG